MLSPSTVRWPKEPTVVELVCKPTNRRTIVHAWPRVKVKSTGDVDRSTRRLVRRPAKTAVRHTCCSRLRPWKPGPPILTVERPLPHGPVKVTGGRAASLTDALASLARLRPWRSDTGMDTSNAAESFRGLLLRHRGRTGLLQRELAARVGVSLRSVQDWEAGVKFPSAERLRALIGAFLDAGSLTPGRETALARELWAAAEREAPRMRTPFDAEWFAVLLAVHAAPTSAPGTDAPRTVPGTDLWTGTAARARDWGEAPDTMGFVGRSEELELLRRAVLEERCRLVAVLGMGGIGKTSVAARLAQQVAPSFDRVYWRSLRNAPPVGDWLAGAIGFLSDQQVVPPPSESERITALLQVLRGRRCLVVLRQFRDAIRAGPREGRYRAGMDGYGRFLQAVGETSHQSCLLLTSREAPPELAVLSTGVRCLELHGLGTTEAQALLADKQLRADAHAWVSW